MARERADVLAQLAEIFRQHGYEGASLTLIGAATGLGKGSLYHFFPGGKEQMAAEVLAGIDGWFEREVYAPLRGTQAPALSIAAMFRAVGDYFHGGGRVCLVGLFALDATRDRFALAVNGYFTRWVAALAMALERGGAQDAQRLAQEVVAGIQGALVLARALDDNMIFVAQLDAMQARLAAALSPATP